MPNYPPPPPPPEKNNDQHIVLSVQVVNLSLLFPMGFGYA